MSVYDKSNPWATNQERLVTEALSASQTPGDVLQELVRPPLPQIRLFPPLYGYRTYGQRQATIDSVIGTPVSSVPIRRTDFSGTEAGIMSSARFVNGAV